MFIIYFNSIGGACKENNQKLVQSFKIKNTNYQNSILSLDRKIKKKNIVNILISRYESKNNLIDSKISTADNYFSNSTFKAKNKTKLLHDDFGLGTSINSESVKIECKFKETRQISKTNDLVKFFNSLPSLNTDKQLKNKSICNFITSCDRFLQLKNDNLLKTKDPLSNIDHTNNVDLKICENIGSLELQVNPLTEEDIPIIVGEIFKSGVRTDLSDKKIYN